VEVYEVKHHHFPLSRVGTHELPSEFEYVFKAVFAVETPPKDRERTLKRPETILRIEIVRVTGKCYVLVVCCVVLHELVHVVTHLENIGFAQVACMACYVTVILEILDYGFAFLGGGLAFKLLCLNSI
jgi:hypothetical protein